MPRHRTPYELEHARRRKKYGATDEGAVAEMRDLVNVLLTREMLMTERYQRWYRNRFRFEFNRQREWYDNAMERGRRNEVQGKTQKHFHEIALAHFYKMLLYADRFVLAGGDLDELWPEEKRRREARENLRRLEAWGGGTAAPEVILDEPDPLDGEQASDKPRERPKGTLDAAERRVIGALYPEGWIGDEWERLGRPPETESIDTDKYDHARRRDKERRQARRERRLREESSGG